MGADELQLLSDATLVERFCATGRMAFFEEIWKRYNRVIYGRCLGFLHGPADAEDATVDTFLRALGSLCGSEFTSGGFRGWLATIAKNLCINQIYKQARRRIDYVDNDQIAGRSIDAESIAEVESVLNQVSDEQRITLKLKYFHGFTDEEVAKYQSWSIRDVKNHAQNGRRMFEKYWKEKASKAKS